MVAIVDDRWSMQDELIPAAVAHPDEAVPPDEADAIERVLGLLSDTVREGARTGPARRDAHPKAHGCARARFRVLDGLPAALRVGMFAEPRAYDAYVRFSNGSPTPQPDAVGDVRGMAIKVMGVEASPSSTQDFVLINGDAFFVRTAADYVAFTTARPQWRFFLPGLNPFDFRLREFLNVRAMTAQPVVDPLAVRYWTTVPLLFGEAVAKVSAAPTGAVFPCAASPSPDFLGETLQRHLEAVDASFDILVQLRTDPSAMPIEDSTIRWRESDAPFVAVAELTLPRQRIADQEALGEALSFTPWHGSPLHRPLGGINRVRRRIYEEVSRLRHDLNGQAREEPRGFATSGSDAT